MPSSRSPAPSARTPQGPEPGDGGGGDQIFLTRTQPGSIPQQDAAALGDLHTRHATLNLYDVAALLPGPARHVPTHCNRALNLCAV